MSPKTQRILKTLAIIAVANLVYLVRELLAALVIFSLACAVLSVVIAVAYVLGALVESVPVVLRAVNPFSHEEEI